MAMLCAQASLSLPCEAAKHGVAARAAEVRLRVDSAVGAMMGANTEVRVAWAALADQHKLATRRRHADASKYRRLLAAGGDSGGSADGGAASVGGSGGLGLAAAVLTSVGAAATALLPEAPLAEGAAQASGCKWLAAQGYRRSLLRAEAVCARASEALRGAHDTALEVRVAAAQVEAQVVAAALQAKAEEAHAVAAAVRRLLAALTKPPAAGPAAAGPASPAPAAGSSSGPAAGKFRSSLLRPQSFSKLGSSAAAGVSESDPNAVAIAWGVEHWAEERNAREAASVKRLLQPFVDAAVLERSRLLTAALDLDHGELPGGGRGSSRRSYFASGAVDEAAGEAAALLEAWGAEATELMQGLVESAGEAKADAAASLSASTSSKMIMRLKSTNRTLVTKVATVTVPVDVLARLEAVWTKIAAVFERAAAAVPSPCGDAPPSPASSPPPPPSPAASSSSAKGKAPAAKAKPATPAASRRDSSLSAQPEDQTIACLAAAAEDAAAAALVLSSAPVPAPAEGCTSKEEASSGTAGVAGLVGLKRSGAARLDVRWRLPARGAAAEDLCRPRPGALVLSADGFLHVFLEPSSAHGGGGGGEVAPVPLAEAAALPPCGPLTFVASTSEPPALTLPLSSAPDGTRCAVSKIMPGLFRILVTSDAGADEEGAGGGAGSGRSGVRDRGRGAGSKSLVALPTALLAAPVARPDPGASQAPAQGTIEAIIVAVPDSEADGENESRIFSISHSPLSAPLYLAVSVSLCLVYSVLFSSTFI